MRIIASAVLMVLAFVGQAAAQAQVPPNAWHPYRGGTNCVQVADAQGNFNCSPFVTINPATGAFSSVLGGPVSQAVTLVIAPTGNTFQGLANDLVIGKSTLVAVAPAGPGVGAATLRIRPSPTIPGYCRLVIAGGNSYNLEFPVALLNPGYPFPNSGLAGPALVPLIDAFQVDFPGGPGGC